MKTLLIVEDEKMIRRGIHTMVQRSGVPVDVIMECSNGEAALEVLKEQEIDVMFTDIRMPKMDGIELVSKVNELENKPLIVAISGYDDFSYAVEMLRNGVKEYILKPVERDKITEVLKRLNEEIESKNEASRTDKKFGEQQLRFLLNNQKISEEEMELLKTKYDSFFLQGGYVCCIVGLSDEIEENDGYILLKEVEDGNVCIMEEQQIEPFLKADIIDMAAGISNVHNGIEEIKEAYDEAVAARKRAFCVGDFVRASDEVKKQPEGLIAQAAKYIDAQSCMQRLQLIGTSKTDELISFWDHLFMEVAKERISISDFVTTIDDFINDVGKIYKNALTEQEHEKLDEFRNVLRYTDLATYQEKLMDFIIELHNRINSQENNNKNQHKMKLAVEYIEANYNKDLNMAVVSNYISMNYSLFSFSFKQYTGNNFVNYLKEIRIREAKRLLADTDMKVIEISQAVGYDNEKHFMKMFKSTCGVSPSEYRKNMRRD